MAASAASDEPPSAPAPPSAPPSCRSRATIMRCSSRPGATTVHAAASTLSSVAVVVSVDVQPMVLACDAENGRPSSALTVDVLPARLRPTTSCLLRMSASIRACASPRSAASRIPCASMPCTPDPAVAADDKISSGGWTSDRKGSGVSGTTDGNGVCWELDNVGTGADSTDDGIAGVAGSTAS